MRSTALITLISGAAMAAPQQTLTGGTDSKDLIQDSIIYAPAVTATVTEYASTTWVQEHITSTIWIDTPASTGEPTIISTKTFKLEGGYGGLVEPVATVSKFTIDNREDDEPTAEETDELSPEAWEDEEATTEAEQHHPTPSPSPSQAPKPSNPAPPTPSTRPKPSTLTTKASPTNLPSPSSPTPSHAAKPQPPAATSHWQGKLLNTTDGTCGPKNTHLAWTCLANSNGTCCSSYGHCGSSPAHCAAGCQAAFGTCGGAVARRSGGGDVERVFDSERDAFWWLKWEREGRRGPEPGGYRDVSKPVEEKGFKKWWHEHAFGKWFGVDGYYGCSGETCPQEDREW